MAKRSWRGWETAGLFFVLAAGNLLHFVYGWSDRSPVAAVFAAVNESTWEHMKLLAMPWILWSLAELAALGKDGSPMARALGLLAGLAAIPMLFYTYQGILGRNVHLLNIVIFQLAVLLAFSVSWMIQKRGLCRGKTWRILGWVILLGVGAIFIHWTFHTPVAPIFADPRTGLAGIPT